MVRIGPRHVFFFSSRRRHTRLVSDWSSDVCSSDLGRMRGSVLKLDGFFPLPAYGGRLLYLFGSTSMGLARTKFGEPLLLPPADGMTTPTSEKTFMFTLPPANRDLYRFGVGFNVFELFKPGGGSK